MHRLPDRQGVKIFNGIASSDEAEFGNLGIRFFPGCAGVASTQCLLKFMKIMSTNNRQLKRQTSIPVIAASYIGPALMPNRDALWEEYELPLNVDTLVNEVMGQAMRRAGRFIKMVACGGLACLQNVPPDDLKGKKTGIFLATGLGNVDEILPFITEVFKHGGGFPSPNQFANSVSNAAAFVLAKICNVTGMVLTVSQEELSFESALWLACAYLENSQIERALVGGCDIFTPTVEEYRERLNLTCAHSRVLPMGEGSSWLFLGKDREKAIGNILAVEFGNKRMPQKAGGETTIS